MNLLKNQLHSREVEAKDQHMKAKEQALIKLGMAGSSKPTSPNLTMKAIECFKDGNWNYLS